MARANSVILSPADKKAAAADLKSKLKAAKDEVKRITKYITDKEKLHAKDIKGEQKKLEAAKKQAASLEAQLEKLKPAPAPAAA